MSMRHFGHSGA
jgi:hypothetical protein